MYSGGATYSTLPLHNSGRSDQSDLRPSAPNAQPYSRGHSPANPQKLHANREWSSQRMNGFMYALHRPHRTGPHSPLSTTCIGASSACGSASGCTTIVSGIPDDANNSDVFGIVLIVDRMYRGLQHPASRAMNVVFALGGCVAVPCVVRVSCLTTSAWSSCGGRGICAGSILWDDDDDDDAGPGGATPTPGRAGGGTIDPPGPPMGGPVGGGPGIPAGGGRPGYVPCCRWCCCGYCWYWGGAIPIPIPGG
eukprot:17545-Pelagococcus_subviridis.AAC.1